MWFRCVCVCVSGSEKKVTEHRTAAVFEEKVATAGQSFIMEIEPTTQE